MRFVVWGAVSAIPFAVIQAPAILALTPPEFSPTDLCVDTGKGSDVSKLVEVVLSTYEECESFCSSVGGCESFTYKENDGKCALMPVSPLVEDYGKPCGKDHSSYVRSPCRWQLEAPVLGSSRKPRYCSSSASLKAVEEYNKQTTVFTEQLNEGNGGHCRQLGKDTEDGELSEKFVVPNLESCMSICLEYLNGECQGVEFHVTNGVPLCEIHQTDVLGTPALPAQGSGSVRCFAMTFAADYVTCQNEVKSDFECGSAYINTVVLNFETGQMEPNCVCVRSDSDCDLQSPSEIAGGSGYWTLRSCGVLIPTVTPTVSPTQYAVNSTSDNGISDDDDIFGDVTKVQVLAVSMTLVSVVLLVYSTHLFVSRRKLKQQTNPKSALKGEKQLDALIASPVEVETLGTGELDNRALNPFMKAARKGGQRLSAQQKSALVSFLEDVEPGLKGDEIVKKAADLEARYSNDEIAKALQNIYHRIPSGLVREMAGQMMDQSLLSQEQENDSISRMI